jgi:hypothetical protein
MDMDAMARSMVGPLLRQGEQINGVGFVSNVVPMFARFFVLVRASYIGHHILVNTNQRLFFLRATLDLLGTPNRVAPPEVLELSDLAAATPFSPVIIGHSAIRLSRRDGFVHEIMWPSTKNGVPGQMAFANGFPSWLPQGVMSGSFAPQPPDGRVPGLSPPTMAGQRWLMIGGGGFAGLLALLTLAAMYPLSMLPLSLPLMVLGGGFATVAMMQLGERKQLVAMAPHERLAHVQRKAAKPRSKLSPTVMVLIAAVAGCPLGFVGFSVYAAVMYHGSDDAKAARAAKAKSKSGPDVPAAPTSTVSTPEKLYGASTRAASLDDGKRYGGKIQELYGKYVFVKLDDGSSVWTEFASLDPPLKDAAEPKEGNCRIPIGTRVKPPAIMARATKGPGKIQETYHLLVRIKFDDGKSGWAKCMETFEQR